MCSSDLSSCRESTSTCGISSPFEELFPTSGQVTHALLTRLPLTRRSVRLACVRHAASVRPEPGSNSQNKRLAFSKPLFRKRRVIVGVCPPCSFCYPIVKVPPSLGGKDYHAHALRKLSRGKFSPSSPASPPEAPEHCTQVVKKPNPSGTFMYHTATVHRSASPSAGNFHRNRRIGRAGRSLGGHSGPHPTRIWRGGNAAPGGKTGTLFGCPAGCLRNRDRKSTRLNSSH